MHMCFGLARRPLLPEQSTADASLPALREVFGRIFLRVTATSSRPVKASKDVGSTYTTSKELIELRIGARNENNTNELHSLVGPICITG